MSPHPPAMLLLCALLGQVAHGSSITVIPSATGPASVDFTPKQVSRQCSIHGR